MLTTVVVAWGEHDLYSRVEVLSLVLFGTEHQGVEAEFSHSISVRRRSTLEQVLNDVIEIWFQAPIS